MKIEHVFFILFCIGLLNGCASKLLHQSINEAPGTLVDIPKTESIKVFSNKKTAIVCIYNDNWLGVSRIDFKDFTQEGRMVKYSPSYMNQETDCVPKKQQYAALKRLQVFEMQDKTVFSRISKFPYVTPERNNVEEGVYYFSDQRKILFVNNNSIYNGFNYFYLELSDKQLIYKKNQFKKILYAFMPITFALDVISFPFQLLFIQGMPH